MASETPARVVVALVECVKNIARHGRGEAETWKIQLGRESSLNQVQLNVSNLYGDANEMFLSSWWCRIKFEATLLLNISIE